MSEVVRPHSSFVNYAGATNIRCVFWYLFVPIVRQVLSDMVELHNVYYVRYQAEKPNPSGCRRIDSWSTPENFGGVNCLTPLNDAVRRDLEQLQEDAYAEGNMEWLNTHEVSIIEAALADAGCEGPWGFHNVWDIFLMLLPLVRDSLVDLWDSDYQ